MNEHLRRAQEAMEAVPRHHFNRARAINVAKEVVFHQFKWCDKRLLNNDQDLRPFILAQMNLTPEHPDWRATGANSIRSQITKGVTTRRRSCIKAFRGKYRLISEIFL